MKAFHLECIGKEHSRRVTIQLSREFWNLKDSLQFESSKQSVYTSCCAQHIFWKIQKAAGNVVFATHFIFALGSKFQWQSNFELPETTQKIHTHLLVCGRNVSTTEIENIKKSQWGKGERICFSAHLLSHVELISVSGTSVLHLQLDRRAWMLVVERRMSHVKADSIKSFLNFIRTENKLLNNCSEVSCDSGTAWKKQLRCYFCSFSVTNAGCLPGLCYYCKFLAKCVAFRWDSCKHCWFFFFSLNIHFAIPSSTPQEIQKRLSNRVWSMIYTVRFTLSVIVCVCRDTALMLTGY